MESPVSTYNFDLTVIYKKKYSTKQKYICTFTADASITEKRSTHLRCMSNDVFCMIGQMTLTISCMFKNGQRYFETLAV